MAKSELRKNVDKKRKISLNYPNLINFERKLDQQLRYCRKIDEDSWLKGKKLSKDKALKAFIPQHISK